MQSKLGFHINIKTYDGQVEKIIRAKPKVMKVISSMGLLNVLHDALPDTIFIARDWNAGDNFVNFIGSDDPYNAAQRWFQSMKSSIEQAPFAYWESFNEMSDWTRMEDYGRFEAARQWIMADYGYRCCIGNFAVGTPELYLWPEFYSALEVCHATHNILGLHEYGGIWMDTWYGSNTTEAIISGNREEFPTKYYEGWLVGRYRKVWNEHIKPNNWTNVRIALTECGLDNVATDVQQWAAGRMVGSWTSCKDVWEKHDDVTDPEAYYAHQLTWLDYVMQEDDYMVGGTIFTWGTLDDFWTNYDIEGRVADKLVDYIQSGNNEVTYTGREYTPVVGEEPFLFSQPDIKSDRLRTLYSGAVLKEISFSPTSTAWLYVETQDGVRGWMPKHTLRGFTSAVIEVPEREFSLVWPTDYRVTTQPFGVNEAFYSKYGLPGHEGLDIRAPLNSNIYACADGKVDRIGRDTKHPYGLHVGIDHGNGYKTIYAHFNEILVELEQEVKAKQIIGKADSTGNSSGHHLHLTLKKKGATARGETIFPNDIIDPTPYFI
jgi:murein DD-endopeptidase MepM/ murein hydrolase activator NlpD